MLHALHGALGHHSDWKGLAAQLAATGNSLRAVDLWRFLDCCAKSLEETGAALATEIEALKDEKAALLGYSMGGRIALHALLERPELWKAAILVAPHSGLEDADARSERLRHDAIWAAKALSGDWKEFLSDWNTQGVLADTEVPDRSRLKQRRQAIALSFTSWSLGAQADLLPRLRHLKLPILWITGSRDEKFTAIAKRAAAVNPRIEHQIIEGASHRLPFSHTDQLSSLITNFLQKHALNP